MNWKKYALYAALVVVGVIAADTIRANVPGASKLPKL